jgi:hypothetical protein
VGRKKLVRKAEPWKPPPEKRDRLEQQPKSRWRPTKNQVVRATKVPAALLITVMVISIIWLLWRDVIRVGGNSYSPPALCIAPALYSRLLYVEYRRFIARHT